MPWRSKRVEEVREEFVLQAAKGNLSVSELCRRYEISRKTGYKWLKRHEEGGFAVLKDKPRCRHSQSHSTNKAIEQAILGVREEHPRWGGRKIRRFLEDRDYTDVPAASTISGILRRHGYISKEPKIIPALHRFEHEAPNRLWQMDFKGHFAMEKGRCHPLTILDDHSRYNLCLQACANERRDTVKEKIIGVLKRYGLPERINVDNGQPWGSKFYQARYTSFSVWLIELGITVSYSKPRHPQTNGKDERFHRTLNEEVVSCNYFRDLDHSQKIFDGWRYCYNHERPHEAIDMQTPVTRYSPSYRSYPDSIKEFDYSDECMVKKIDCRGRLNYKGKSLFVGMPFASRNVALRNVSSESKFDVFFRHQKINVFDLNKECF